MKAKFLALVALVLGLASCQKDTEGFDVAVNGEVSTKVTVNLADDSGTRAGSNESGLRNGVLEGNNTLRYILQVFDEDGEQSKAKMFAYTDDQTVAFDVRLVPGRNYKFVVWADVVTGENAGDWHYDTTDLTNITLKGAWNAMDETRDAFTCVKTVEDFNATTPINITLTRPFAKLRVVTTDMNELMGVNPQYAEVEYTTAYRPSFNAFAGSANAKGSESKTHTYRIASYNETGASKTLFTDYLFAIDDQEPVQFILSVYEDKQMNSLVRTTHFNTDIPVKRNYLTTITGNVLTDGNEINVEIEDEFDTPAIEVLVWDGESVERPELDETTNTYAIEKPSQLAWLAAAVNGTLESGASTTSTRASNDIDTFDGKTFKLEADIDLGGNEWTPISMSTDLAGGKTFRGTFDGQGHTISGLYVNQKDVAGLFGYIYAATIKNVTIESANIKSNHYAGGVVGWVLNTRGNIQVPFIMENCHVKNSTIASTPELVDGEWDNGDKVGGLVGYACFGSTDYPANEGAKISNCSVKNSTVKAYRDFGGLIGYASYVAIENCVVSNVTLKQDLTHDYKAPNTPTTFGMIIGRSEGGNTIDGQPYNYTYIAEGVYKTADDIYHINNAAGLKWFAAEINAIEPYEASEYDNATFKLDCDIDLNNEEWTPIGDWASQRTEFHGTFDGQGFTISNIKISKPCERGKKQEDSAYGLFGNVKGGTVKNVTLSNVEVSGVAKFSAALVGRLNGNVENCHVNNASITCSSWQIGGLVAQYNSGTISGCSVENTTITSGIGAVGAIAGYALTNVERTIENCSVKNCTLAQTEPYGAGYDDMYATILGGVHIANTVININGCTAENNTIKGTKSDNLVGYIEPGAKVYVDGNLYACAETTEQLEAALKAGGHIALVNNIAMTKSLALSNANFVLEGNGYTITMTEDATNTYALFDITGGKAAMKNIVFDGIKEGAVVRTVGVEFEADNVTSKNGSHTQQQGLFRLMGKSTIKNSTFKNNTCSMVITLNYDGANNDPQVVENCVFEGNTCNGTAVLYYVKGAGATINGNKFIGNTVNCKTNGATVYMGFTENNVVTNNLFQNNTVNEANTSSRVAGGVFFGYDTEFSGNAFIGNKVTGENAKGNDVCVSTYYTSINLSGNYWGGNAPVEDTNYFVQHKSDERVVIMTDYLTENPFN